VERGSRSEGVDVVHGKFESKHRPGADASGKTRHQAQATNASLVRASTRSSLLQPFTLHDKHIHSHDWFPGRTSGMADNDAVAKMQHLDPHERPPITIRNVYKKYQKMKSKALDQDQDIIDLSSDAAASSNSKVRVIKEYAAQDLTATFRAFAGEDAELEHIRLSSSIPVYEHEDMPGKALLIVFLTSPVVHVVLLTPRVFVFMSVFSPDGR
jgi:hypothetical protein